MRITVTLIILLINVACSSAQNHVKRDLYLLFNIDSNNYKQQITLYEGKGKTSITKDVYCFKLHNRADGKKMVLAYVPFSNKQLLIKDSSFVKNYVKTVSEINKLDGIKYEINDVKFPFNKVYIVEKISPNKYKAMRVTSYIGSSFYP